LCCQLCPSVFGALLVRMSILGVTPTMIACMEQWQRALPASHHLSTAYGLYSALTPADESLAPLTYYRDLSHKAASIDRLDVEPLEALYIDPVHASGALPLLSMNAVSMNVVSHGNEAVTPGHSGPNHHTMPMTHGDYTAIVPGFSGPHLSPSSSSVAQCDSLAIVPAGLVPHNPPWYSR